MNSKATLQRFLSLENGLYLVRFTVRSNDDFYAALAILRGYARQGQCRWWQQAFTGKGAWICPESILWDLAQHIAGLTEELEKQQIKKQQHTYQQPQTFSIPHSYRDALVIFGLQPPITDQFIKTRYRELAIANHPDRGGSTEKMAQINVAYEFLKGK